MARGTHFPYRHPCVVWTITISSLQLRQRTERLNSVPRISSGTVLNAGRQTPKSVLLPAPAEAAYLGDVCSMRTCDLSLGCVLRSHPCAEPQPWCFWEPGFLWKGIPVVLPRFVAGAIHPYQNHFVVFTVGIWRRVRGCECECYRVFTRK